MLGRIEKKLQFSPAVECERRHTTINGQFGQRSVTALKPNLSPRFGIRTRESNCNRFVE
jgi:hypothetical protein